MRDVIRPEPRPLATADAAVRTHHRRARRRPPTSCGRRRAALRLSDTRPLGRLVRWRIPGVGGDQTFDELFRAYPFTLLDEGDEPARSPGCAGGSGRSPRDYPRSPGPTTFAPGTSAGRCGCCSRTGPRRARTAASELVSEARVEPVDRAAALRLRALWTVIGPFERWWAPSRSRRPCARRRRTALRRLPELEAGERRLLVDQGPPSAPDAQAQPARQHLLRAHLDPSLPHAGTGSRCAAFLAGLALELQPIARGSHPHAPAVRVDANLSSGDRRNEAQHPLAQPHHDGCRRGAHTE